MIANLQKNERDWRNWYVFIKKGQRSKVLSAKELKQVSDDKIRLTEYFIPAFPALLTKYKANPEKVANHMWLKKLLNNMLKWMHWKLQQKHCKLFVVMPENKVEQKSWMYCNLFGRKLWMLCMIMKEYRNPVNQYDIIQLKYEPEKNCCLFMDATVLTNLISGRNYSGLLKPQQIWLVILKKD